MTHKTKHKHVTYSNTTIKGFSSSELLNLENGTLKLIKIEPKSDYPEHLHPDKTEYAVVLEGNPSFLIDNEIFSSEIGDIFTFPKNIKHSISNQTDSLCILLIGAIKTH